VTGCAGSAGCCTATQNVNVDQLRRKKMTELSYEAMAFIGLHSLTTGEALFTGVVLLSMALGLIGNLPPASRLGGDR
jgi:ribose/xylose/arabinose/galactoside ABC-type transport system permease subunit